jgi:hypothetical protein
LCQDLRLIEHLPRDYGNNLSAVVSFNDKCLPGLMGGGILTQLELLPATGRLAPYWTRTLHLWGIKKAWQSSLRPALRRHLSTPARLSDRNGAFEHSYCVTFPWTFEEVPMTHIQAAVAVLGLRRLEGYARRKQQLLRSGLPLRRTRFLETTPYVIVDPSARQDPAILGRRRKGPYAVHGKPKESLHPDMLIVHNKGFADWR